MPRLTAEQRSADIQRAGMTAPEPPDDLPETAKQLWRDVAATKPADVWNPANLDLLKTFCLMSHERDFILHNVLWTLPPPSRADYHSGMNDLLAVSKLQLQAASALRLTIQNLVARQSGKITEKGVRSKGPTKRKLLGGNAVWQGRNEAKLN